MNGVSKKATVEALRVSFVNDRSLIFIDINQDKSHNP
jgi:hypothetical protein